MLTRLRRRHVPVDSSGSVRRQGRAGHRPHPSPLVRLPYRPLFRPGAQPPHRRGRNRPAVPLREAPRTRGGPALHPLNPKTNDYAGAVLFNAHASTLWARFTIYLRREIAARLGMTQNAARTVLRVSFAKVAEYQKRGVVHFHAVIRLDGPDGSTQPRRPAPS
ncbi:replication initiator [Kitasatospora atroaurantiaca]|uniref:replication initiator n=1 Tax=Kitasatospora atroaurantiaca TaxID=285545 RepID=UPI0031D45222